MKRAGKNRRLTEGLKDDLITDLDAVIGTAEFEVGNLVNTIEGIMDDYSSLYHNNENYRDFLDEIDGYFCEAYQQIQAANETLQNFIDYYNDEDEENEDELEGDELIEYVEDSDDFEAVDFHNYATAIDWGMSWKQVIEWAERHRDGTKEQKEWIEDLFEDINFHAENSMMAQGREDELIQKIKSGEWQKQWE